MDGFGQQRARVALVTGGHRGLGAGIALALQSAGLGVAVTYATRGEEAASFAARHDLLALQLDQSDAASVDAAIARVEDELGPVDVLINNAGIAQEQPFLELTDADWERMLSVNLLGPVRLVRRALPGMLEREFGRIVNVSSIGGQWGGRNQLHYAAAKAGLINFTRSLANLYSSAGVTANAIAPGLVATEMSAAELESDAGRAKVAGIPAGRLGTVAEVGALARFLATDEAAYLTGQTFNLNGGMLFST